MSKRRELLLESRLIAPWGNLTAAVTDFGRAYSQPSMLESGRMRAWQEMGDGSTNSPLSFYPHCLKSCWCFWLAERIWKPEGKECFCMVHTSYSPNLCKVEVRSECMHIASTSGWRARRESVVVRTLWNLEPKQEEGASGGKLLLGRNEAPKRGSCREDTLCFLFYLSPSHQCVPLAILSTESITNETCVM